MAANFVLSAGSDDGSSGIATSSGALTFGGHPAAAGPTTSSTQGARSSILSSSPGGSAAQGLATISDGGDGGDLGGTHGANAGQGTGNFGASVWPGLTDQVVEPGGQLPKPAEPADRQRQAVQVAANKMVASANLNRRMNQLWQETQVFGAEIRAEMRSAASFPCWMQAGIPIPR